MMHELTRKLWRTSKSKMKEYDNVIVAWLKETAKALVHQIDVEVGLVSSSKDRVNQILGLTEKTLEEKFNEYLDSRLNYKEYGEDSTAERLAKIAKEHYEKLKTT